jgi:hypothetical protein
MVLCLMAMDGTFGQVKGAVEADGWTEVVTFTNPNM